MLKLERSLLLFIQNILTYFPTLGYILSSDFELTRKIALEIVIATYVSINILNFFLFSSTFSLSLSSFLFHLLFFIRLSLHFHT